jgi:hypothetical protein
MVTQIKVSPAGIEPVTVLGEEASGAPLGLDGLGNVVGENRRVRCRGCFAPRRSLVASMAIKSQST